MPKPPKAKVKIHPSPQALLFAFAVPTSPSLLLSPHVCLPQEIFSTLKTEVSYTCL